MKRLLSILLAAIMIFSMSLTAFADGEPTTGSKITVTNATKTKTYNAYKIFDLTYQGDKVSYTYTPTGETDTFLEALKGSDSPFEVAKTTSGFYNVSLTDGKTSADIVKFFADNLKLDGVTPAASVKATSTTVELNVGDQGYYYVTTTLGSVVTIDSTLPDVKIVDKNQGPSWDNGEENPGDPSDPSNPGDPYPQGNGKVIVLNKGEDNEKKVTVDDAAFGDTVDFNISVNASAFVSTELVTKYYITDTLPAGFDAPKNIVVKVTPQDGTEKTLVKDTDYTLTTTGNEFEVAVPFGLIYNANAVITVEYQATVKDTAAIAGKGNVNKANFTYVTTPYDPDKGVVPGHPGNPDDPNDPATPDKPIDPTKPEDMKDPDNFPDTPTTPSYDEDNEKTTTTYVYAIGIQKVDEKYNALKGAKFSVAFEDGSAVKAVATATPGVYNYAKDGTVTEFSTDDNGLLVIKGLDVGTYTITETLAPAGYNQLTETVDITVARDDVDSYTKTITCKDTEDKDHSYTAADNVSGTVIVNQTGSELPSTGGMGTRLFYIFGGLLVTAACVLLITRRRMAE